MQATFERSPDTDSVIAALRGVNQEISYADLARVSSLSIARAKGVLTSARRALARENNIIFGTIVGYGLRRLADTDKVRKSDANKKRIRRAAGRALSELKTIEAFDRLPPTDQVTATVNRTVFEMIRQHAKTQAAPVAEPTKPAEAPATGNLVALSKRQQKIGRT